MNGNAELLNFIYQNSQMGVETIDRLVDVVTDKDMKKHLEYELSEYMDIHKTAKEKLNQNGYDEKGIGSFDKAKTDLMLNFQTAKDKSPSHIAEMLITGSNMGVIDAVKNRKKYDGAETDILNLMQRLEQFEENNIQTLKNFL